MPSIIPTRLCAIAVTTFAATSSSAFESLDGYYIATDRCEAYQSKNRLTNPGDVQTEQDRAYPMLGMNKPAGDFFQIRINGAPVTESRWVHVSCGVHAVEAGTETDPGTQPVPDIPVPQGAEESTENLLALSWQPAFCETRPSKTECQQLNDGLLPVTETQLSIHGLWPQPNGNFFCEVPQAVVALDKARRWQDLPEVPVDSETREALETAMPGTASFLDRHEWIKHGTCYFGAGGADEYFDDTLLLTDAINGSVVGGLLAAHVGGEVTASEIRAAFDTAFGEGAGDSVQVQCSGDQTRVLIQEITVQLRGTITPDADLGDLMRAADPVSAGCKKGVIDPTGLQ